MKKKIAVIAGGDSGEYGISMKSGSVVARSLDKNRYDVYLILIKGSDWFYERDEEKFQIDKNDFSLTFDGQHIHFDCVFCAIHGTPGENGKLPAYFEMLSIPFTASGSFTSALTFHKNFCNHVVAAFNVNTPRSVLLNQPDMVSVDEIVKQLSLPVFVKPNAGGSSVGMSKVKQQGELFAAIQTAFREDTEVLVEEFVDGRELTCGVIEAGGRMLVLPLCEIVSKKEFFDFEAKYDPALADEIVPAPISEALAEEIRNTSAMLYKKLNCRGVVRFDYIYSAKKKMLYFLEGNTVPGLTEESIVPKMARSMGISLPQLFSMMVEDAVEKHQKFPD
jgi:D-alanine-D-alanine ligase